MPTTAPIEPAWDTAMLQTNLPRHVLTGSMRYKEFEPLGQGGKAEVFRCQDVTLGRSVAYKILHHSLLGSEIEQQMLVREARIMASLDHRSIPIIHDLGRDHHARPYFTMTLVEGETLFGALNDLRKSNEPHPRLLTLEQRIAHVLQAGETLCYAHQQGIVHGDIKPENLILSPDGTLRLVDWGLATTLAAKPETDGQRLENLWGRQGSPLYMSPEQVAQDPLLQPASDVYSLGAVLYECLTLRNPLRGKTALETVRMVADVEPELPSKVAPSAKIPPQLEQACMRALAKSPLDRFQSMGEFCELLRDCHLDLLVGFER